MKRRDEAYKYLEIENYLRGSLARGVYTADKPIESENRLSEMFGLSRATVRHALSKLEGEGLIERRQGRRSYAVEERPVYHGRRHSRVALVTYDPAYFDMQALRESAVAALAAEGYEVVMRFITDSIAGERLVLEELIELPLDGFIIEGIGTSMPTFNIDLFRRIEGMGVPMVFTNGFHRGVRAAHVVAGDRAVMRGMVEHLAALGHRTIGGIFAGEQYQGLMRYQGFMDGLRAHGLEYRDRSIMFLSFADRRYIFDNLFNAYRDSLLGCTAIVCFSDSYAEFLEATLLRNGVSIPDGMSVTGMDNLPASRTGSTRLTTATLPLGEMGERAARTLMEMIATRGEVESSVVDCQFVLGDSTRPLK
jgi:GntR family transcriptional regulator of arabinose operon